MRAARQIVPVSDVEVQLADLRQRVEALERHQSRPRDRADQDARLLSAIAATLGGEVFAAGDLLQRAAPHPELIAVLAAVDVRTLGLWLRRLARRPVSGYRLIRCKREAGGQLWTVRVDGGISTKCLDAPR